MAEITQKVYIPSLEEYKKYFEKFRAFLGAKLSEKAKRNDAYESNYYHKGIFPLRTGCADSSNEIWFGNETGNLESFNGNYDQFGLRVAMQLYYNPEFDFVKETRIETRTTLIYDETIDKPREVSGSAPIIKFGENDYIWLNKEECESGKDITMKLWSLDILDKAVPFDEDLRHNDWAKATALQKQAYLAATRFCTTFELGKMVPVKISDKDGYASAEPVFEKEEGIFVVKALYDRLASNVIDEEGLRVCLKQTIKACSAKDRVSVEDIGEIKQTIAYQQKAFESALKSNVDKAVDDTNDFIDNLNLGGK